MFSRFFPPALAQVQEFQSAVIRIFVWLLMMVLIGIASHHGIYPISWTEYAWLFGVHFIWYVGLLTDVIRRPEMRKNRTYFAVLADLSGTTFAIYLSGQAISPFYLLYIWSFFSQGTRYGRDNLLIASVGSFMAYLMVATLLGAWQSNPLELFFMLTFLLILPLYQYSLLSQLHRAKQAAEDATQARGGFLATMTHELRTPLSGVIGMARLLKGSTLNDEQREYVESINASASVLQSLIGDILDLSKIDAGKLSLRQERFDLRASLVEIANALSNQALDRGVEVIVAVSPATPTYVRGDALRFRQIFFNLVGNAVKFTEQGQIVIRAQVDAPNQQVPVRHLSISVIDSGIGIRQEKLAEIFDSFWQEGDAPHRSRYGGTGLGTTIARDLTRLMGGAIGVESEFGKGSHFWVKLPILDREALFAPQAPATLDARHALVVESNPAQARQIEEALHAGGMTVSLFADVADIHQRSFDDLPDIDVLIVSDTPRGKDLAGVAARVRSLIKHRVPVLYLHFRSRKMALSEAAAAGLSKPFSMLALWRQVSNLIEPGSVPEVAPSQRERLQTQVRPLKVLVAEDDTVNGKLISNLLDHAGHRATWVRDGEAALNEVQLQLFDIAFIDLRMPKMNGLDFVKAYRQLEHGQRLPIVALTANAAEDAKADCLQAGMDDFLTKPVDPETLEQMLKRYCES